MIISKMSEKQMVFLFTLNISVPVQNTCQLNIARHITLLAGELFIPEAGKMVRIDIWDTMIKLRDHLISDGAEILFSSITSVRFNELLWP